MIRHEAVAEATRARVQKAIDELGYRPITAPRSAAGARSYVLCLLHMPPIASFASGLIMGASEAARAEGYSLMVEGVTATDPAARAAWVRQLAIQSNLDGVILVPPLGDDAAIVAALDDLGVPICRIAPRDTDPARAWVAIDDTAAAREVTERLLADGHRRIAFLTGPEERSTAARRLAGFREAMAGLSDAEPLVVPGDYSFRAGFEAGQHFLAMPNRPTAVFCSTDEMAAGVLVAAHKLGLAMPADLSVFGFDDSVIAAVVWPPLSTVRQPLIAMGQAAVSQLVTGWLRPGATGGPAEAARLIPYELVVRETSGPAPRA